MALVDKSKDDRGAGELRARALLRARETAASTTNSDKTPSQEDPLRLIHELQVHQIELELQNEELSRAYEELEASRARYFELYDLAPVGYLTVSKQGVIVEANLTTATLLGVKRSALAGKPFASFILTEDQGVFHGKCALLGDQGAQHSWDLRMIRPDSPPFWAHLQADQAQSGECRITLNDISELKRTEATIVRIEARLRQLQKAESLERMAAAIAHHFNNKLHAVIGNLELVTADPACVVDSAAPLGDALQAALQAAEMSTLMLTFTGQTAGNPKPLDLSEVCRRHLPLLREALPTGLPLEANVPAPGPIVSAREEQIPQLLINLVSNAGDAVGKGAGAVRLAVTTVSPAEIPEEHRFPVDWEPKSAGYACLEVADTGRGMAAEDVERIFDPFFSDKFTGRGMGLSVVLGIVRAHGGAVSVESQPGRGSTFRVFLPLFLGEAPPAAKKATEWISGGTVLLVDDEDLVRNVTSSMLRGLGFAVLGAAGGPEAVAELGKHPAEIRLVLCDLSMPGMNGWETLTALRALVPGIPVILSSGYDRAQAMAGHHPELPQCFLRKPYRLGELSEAIRLALGATTTPGYQPRLGSPREPGRRSLKKWTPG